MKHIKPSKLAYWAIYLIYFAAFFYYQQWRDHIISGGDQWGYYAYLPSFFVYGDLANLQDSYRKKMSYHTGFGGYDGGEIAISEAYPSAIKGNQVIKYTMGVAVLQSPFFIAGHFAAPLLGYPADGYSPPYIFLAHLSALLWALFGLWWLRKILLRIWDEGISAAILLTIGLGTNLYFFALQTMAHAYLFAWWAILIYATIRFYENFKYKHALVIGLSVGFISLIRPVELISFLVPMLYGIYSRKTFILRARALKEHWRKYLVAVIVTALVGIPQLLYWKHVSGNWLFYSYGSETFNFAKPEIINGLTSFSNGWLVYTPVMLGALLGLPLLWRSKYRDWFWVLCLVLPLHIYITYSWWCWNYINGFGSRPMVDVYALTAIPLAAFVGFFLTKKVLRIAILTALTINLFFNIFKTYQFHIGVLWSECANRRYYLSTFFKTQLDYHDLVIFDTNERQPDSSQLKKIALLGEEKFEDSTGVEFTRQPTFSGNFAFTLMPKKESPKIAIPLASLGKEGWLRISAQARKSYTGSSIYLCSQLVCQAFRFNEQGGMVKQLFWKDIRIDNKINCTNDLWGGRANEWGYVHFWTKIHQRIDAQPHDTLYVFALGNQRETMWIDDLQIEWWK